MKCDKIQELLPLYIDNELDPRLTEFVKAHLEECKTCRDDLASLISIIGDVKASYPQIDVPKDFNDKLHKKLMGISDDENETVYKLPKKFNINNLVRYSSLAACLVILLLAVTFISEYESAYKKNLPEQSDLKSPGAVALESSVPSVETVLPNNQAAPFASPETQKPKTKPVKGAKAIPKDTNAAGNSAESESGEVAEPESYDLNAEPNDTDAVLPTEDSALPSNDGGQNSGESALEQEEPEPQPELTEPTDSGGGGGAGGANSTKMVSFALPGLTKIELDNTPKVTYTMQITPAKEQKQTVTSHVTGIMYHSGNMFSGDINAYNDIKIYCINNKIKYSETKKDYTPNYKQLVTSYNSVVDDIEKNGSNPELENKARVIREKIDSINSNTSTHYVLIN